MIIAVDFDGTLCENAFPEIGKPKHEVIDFVRECHTLLDATVILWTCRTDKALEEAVEWCTLHGIPIDLINENTEAIKEEFGGDPRKIYADKYLDDKALEVYTVEAMRENEVSRA